MPYPLGGTVRSAAIDVAGPTAGQIAPDGTSLAVDIVAIRASTWPATPFTHARSAVVEVAGTEHHVNALDIQAIYIHNLPGIGGRTTAYVPSFPQLNRNATTTPNAL